MKTMTCREIMNGVGGCDLAFSGVTPMEVATQCSSHIAASTDDAHRAMRELMRDPSHTEADRAAWFEWFTGEWAKRPDH